MTHTDTHTLYDVIIIGSGPAGYTAAIYAARANLKTLVIEGWTPGGLLTTTTTVENYPGFPEGVDGNELMLSMSQQAENCGAELVTEMAESIDAHGFVKGVTTEEGEYYTRTIIVATGSSPRMLGVAGEKEMMGRGVSTCATCDGSFFADKNVAVIGGGDSAMEEALYLSGIASHVTVVHRKDTFRASPVMLTRAQQNDSISFITGATVDHITPRDTGSVGSLVINKSGETEGLDVDGVFVAIGHIPNTDFLPQDVAVDDNGYIRVDDTHHTSVEGVFACGDVVDSTYQQAITAAGSGSATALEVFKYLEGIDNEG